MNEKEQLLADVNSNSHLLETARQITDWDSAAAICDKLCNLYRRLELLRLQKPDGP